MTRKILLVVTTFIALGMGCLSAQNATPVAQKAPRVSVKKTAHQRIVKLKDRIKNQRERIAQGLKDNTLTADQAQAGRDVLNSVESQMKEEHKANGTKKTISKDTYEAYNTSLDANSAFINEGKQYFYYYGPYVDNGPYYDYYYDEYPVAGAPTPSVSTMEETHPMIFELKDRIKNQRERISQGLNNNTLTGDQAKACGEVLDSVEKQMKADYPANGAKKSMILTREQYTAFNTSLDSNSKFIQEEKQYFYYYGPYNNEYYF
jgi:hypothetical protein